MRVKNELGILLSKAGAVCPLCSSNTIRGTYFCSRCGRSGRLHIDPAGIRESKKEVFIPRQLAR